jgi:hypothetical protein
MIDIEDIFKYLEKKIPNFQKIGRGGKKIFTCWRASTHTYNKIDPSMFLINGTDKYYCQDCGWKGSIYDLVKAVENKSMTDEEVIAFLTNILKVNAYPELDVYDKYGWSLIKVSKNGKIPMDKEWEKSKTTKAEWVKWIEQGYNVGARTGKDTGITLIDVDLKVAPNGKLEEIYKLLTASKTLIQNSPHGKHFVFKYDLDIPQSQKLQKIGLTIDTRNDGGQFLVSPSKINNLSYSWVNLGSDIKNASPELKAKLLELLQVDLGRKSEMSQEVSQNIEIVKEGCRNNLLVSLGGLFLKQLTPSQVEFVLSVINHNFLKPILPVSEIKAMLGSLEGYKKTEEETQEEFIYDACKLLQTDISAKDIMEHAFPGDRNKRAIVDKYLAKFHKEGKLVRLARGRYDLKAKVEWTTEEQTKSTPINYKIPYFDDIAYFHNGDIILIGAASGRGKCITDGLLLTNQGFIDIAEIGNYRKDGISYDKGRHIRLFTGKKKNHCYRAPNYFWKEKVNNTIKIITEHGYEIEGTPDHPIAIINKSTINKSHLSEFKKLKDIHIGNYTLIVAPNLFPKSQQHKYKKFNLNKISKHTTNIYKLKKDITNITPDLARLIGYIVGDGSLQKNTINIYFNKNNKNYLKNDIEKILAPYGIVPHYYIKKNCLRILINSKFLTVFIRNRIYKQNKKIINIKSPYRFIPIEILKGNKEIQLNFINGLLSCESSLNKFNSLEITMASEKLMKTLHIMFLNLGIFCDLALKKVKKYQQNTYWRIKLSNEMTYKLFSLTAPIKYTDIKLDYPKKKYAINNRFANNQYIKDIYFIDKIIKIEYNNIEKYVYDFNIENKKYKINNQFWCNGFVNHNTHIAMNFIKQMKEQGIIPYYISLEAGSRHNKIAKQLELTQKDYYISKEEISNPLQIEIESNAFTIIDWLYSGDDFSATQSIYKHLNDEMLIRGGILVVFTQLKEDNGWFAPNLVKSFPRFATRFIWVDSTGLAGQFEVDKITDPKGHNANAIISTEFNFDTKEIIKKDF